MADLVMPLSQPCQFNQPWIGMCRKPTTNGWCSEHEPLECVSCGKKAVRSCGETMGSFVCGSPLCAHCRHLNKKHVTIDVYQVAMKQEQNAQNARIASRRSPDQLMDPVLHVPLNLFELLKNDHSSYALQKVYYLSLTHSLMGFFPAIYNTDDERPAMIITTDITLIFAVWCMLDPHESSVGQAIAYVDSTTHIAYIDKDSQSDQEGSLPIQLLIRPEFNKLCACNTSPFRWAPGLIGSATTPERFLQIINKAKTQYMNAS